MAIRIICISKDHGYHENSHVAISYLGWINEATNQRGYTSRIDMYNWIVQGGIAYVSDIFGNTAYLRPRISPHGNPYVQTEADATPTDNLLRLPEC
jgi:hypothetical protein